MKHILIPLACLVTSGLPAHAAPVAFETLGLQGRGATSGAPDSLVVFLHGYGSNGSDFVDVTEIIAQYLPNTMFLYPDAPTPEPSKDGRPSFTWYSFAGEDAESTRQAAMEYVSGKINLALTTYGIPEERIVIAGFSQGAGTAVMTATCGPFRISGAVAMAGVVDTVCEAPTDRKPADILFVHNAGDTRVPTDWALESVKVALEVGYTPSFISHPGDQHWLVPQGLADVSNFVVSKLTR